MTIAKKINKIITKREFQRFLLLSLKDFLTIGTNRIAYINKTTDITIEKKQDSMPIIGFFKLLQRFKYSKPNHEFDNKN